MAARLVACHRGNATPALCSQRGMTPRPWLLLLLLLLLLPQPALPWL